MLNLLYYFDKYSYVDSLQIIGYYSDFTIMFDSNVANWDFKGVISSFGLLSDSEKITENFYSYKQRFITYFLSFLNRSLSCFRFSNVIDWQVSCSNSLVLSQKGNFFVSNTFFFLFLIISKIYLLNYLYFYCIQVVIMMEVTLELEE